jgi:hypothetical protein
MWRRPRPVTADTKSPAPQSAHSGWWRGAFAPDPATGTEAGPGPTTPRRSAVRRTSRLHGRGHASQAWRRALLRDTYKAGRLWALRQSPHRGSAATKVKKGRKKNPDTKRAGTEETGLFDMVNRKRRGAMHRRDAGAPSRQRQRARVPAERAPRRAFLYEVPVRARESRDPGATRRAGHESGRTTGVLFAS